jgi:hypothetical protein
MRVCEGMSKGLHRKEVAKHNILMSGLLVC